MRLDEIGHILEEKMEFVTQLMPEQFQERFKNNAFLAGGCIYSLYHDKTPKDYDFFLKDKAFAQELYNYFKSLTGDIHHGTYNGYNLTLTKYAITIGTNQIIIKYSGSVYDVVAQFDFKHNMFAYDYGVIRNFTDWTYLYEDKLVFNDYRARDICGTLMRIPKFVDRGMKISKQEHSKILKKLHQNGFDNNELDILNTEHTY